eukprot:379007-Prymnesium_polylepis.2
MRPERPCALRDRSCDPGKNSEYIACFSHIPHPPQRLRPENAPRQGLSAKLPLITIPTNTKIALVHDWTAPGPFRTWLGW